MVCVNYVVLLAVPTPFEAACCSLHLVGDVLRHLGLAPV